MDVEYKVIQAQTPMFADRAQMKATLEQEAQAGWQLFEKEDNYKLKLVRDISHRANDESLGFDPYRTAVGVSPLITYGATALVTIALVATILYFALWTNS